MKIFIRRLTAALPVLIILVVSVRAHDVIGLVTFPDSTDHSGIRVTIQGAVTETVYTTSIGSYTFTGLSSNYYSFTYNYPGYTEARLENIPVLADKALAQVYLSPVPDTFTVSGTIRCGTETLHDGVQVKVSTLTGTVTDSAVTGPSGTFSVLAADSGLYRFTFKKLGFRTTVRESVLVDSDAVLADTVRLVATPVIRGVVQLYERSAHDGILVSLAGGTVADSVITGSGGTFALSTPDTGYYNLNISKDNWHDRSFTSLHILADTLLDTVFLDTFSTDTVYAGTLKTDQRWSANHIRSLAGDLIIDTGVTLTIEAGTKVRPATVDSMDGGLDPGQVELIVRGRLVAEGDSSSTVSMYVNLNAGSYSWRGIRVTGAGASADLRHCLIADAHTGVRADSGGSVTVTGGNIRLNLIGALITGGTSVIHDTRFEKNTGSGILCTRSSADIAGCKLWDNSGNPLNISGGAVSVFNTLIYKNGGTAGISVTDSAEVYIYNSSVLQNGLYGLTNARSRVILFNNIFTGHTQNAVSNDATAISAGIEIAYNTFYDNGAAAFRNCPADLELLTTVTAAGDSCDRYCNLYTDPGLTDWTSHVTLDDTSACIASGTDTFISVQTGDTVTVATGSDSLPNRGHDADITRTVMIIKRAETLFLSGNEEELWFLPDGRRTAPHARPRTQMIIRVLPGGRVVKQLLLK